MEKVDGRKISHGKRERIRVRAVQRVEAGESPEKVIKDLGFHRSCIYQWLAKYRKYGYYALKTKKISGRPTKISYDQRKLIFSIITSENPLEFAFETALWTKEIISELIFRIFEIKISVNTVDRLLRKMNLYPKEPRRNLYQQDQIKRWKIEKYPEIRKQARSKKAIIYFCNESGIDSGHMMISTLTTKGALRFMVIRSPLNAKKFINFLTFLIHNMNRPVYLILDRHRAHEVTIVDNFVKSTKGKLKLFFLPLDHRLLKLNV